MSQAFDHVSHQTLMSKLYNYGIRGNAYDWIKSYLKDRVQYVEVTKIVKQHKKIFRSQLRFNRVGVPQGSILGPLLFLIYVNDLPNCTEHQTILFADDTTLIIQGNNRQILQNEINKTLGNVVAWLNHNNLTVNLSKTQLINFKTYQQKRAQLNVTFDQVKINETETATFLGVTIDSYCNWKAQVDKVCTKIDRFTYLLKRLRITVSERAATIAYHAYVSSTLRYGLILWGNSVEAIRVFRAQKRCMRALCGADYLDSCKPLFKKKKILPLPGLYILEMCIFIRKNIQLFPQINCNRNRRQQLKFEAPAQRLSMYRRNVYCMAIKIYNYLPDHIKVLTTKKFKNYLTSKLLNETIYDIKDYFKMKFD